MQQAIARTKKASAFIVAILVGRVCYGRIAVLVRYCCSGFSKLCEVANKEQHDDRPGMFLSTKNITKGWSNWRDGFVGCIH
jgi:hypothetical protein